LHGGLSRRFGLRTILLFSFAAAVVRFLMIGWGVEWLSVVVLAQLLHGLTFGAYHAAAIAAVNRWFPGRCQARGQALYSSVSFGAGGLVGSLLSGWTWDAWGRADLYREFGVCCRRPVLRVVLGEKERSRRGRREKLLAIRSAKPWPVLPVMSGRKRGRSAVPRRAKSSAAASGCRETWRGSGIGWQGRQTLDPRFEALADDDLHLVAGRPFSGCRAANVAQRFEQRTQRKGHIDLADGDFVEVACQMVLFVVLANDRSYRAAQDQVAAAVGVAGA
jgi:hypothetical protein